MDPFRMSETAVIVKVGDKAEVADTQRPEGSAHLAFRRIIVHDFSEESEPQPVRFHYREHSKHLSPHRAA